MTTCEYITIEFLMEMKFGYPSISSGSSSYNIRTVSTASDHICYPMCPLILVCYKI